MRNNKQKQRPIYRVSFARITGQDDKGNDQLGAAREIGAIWSRKNGGAILRFDHIPVELTNHQGVVFISSNDIDEQGRS